MYANNAIFFPYDILPSLRTARGSAWQALVERVMTLPELHEESLALVLTLIRMNGCVGCETDSFRAMRGCAPCARQMLRRYKGSDADLLADYDAALREVRAFVAAQCAAHPAAIFGTVVADTTDAAPPSNYVVSLDRVEVGVYAAG